MGDVKMMGVVPEADDARRASPPALFRRILAEGRSAVQHAAAPGSGAGGGVSFFSRNEHFQNAHIRARQ